MWYSFNSGNTIGQEGTEGGLIINDEEHIGGARITLEKNCLFNTPFAITCGIYGVMVHTVYSSKEDEATKKYCEMKKDLDTILKTLNDSNISEILDKFIGKY